MTSNSTSFNGISLEELTAIDSALERKVKDDQCIDGECIYCSSTCSGSSCSNTSCIGNSGYIQLEPKYKGRVFERTFKYLKDQVKIHKVISERETELQSTKNNESKYILSGGKCENEGQRTTHGDSCFECRGGQWHYVNNSIVYKNNPSVQVETSGEEEVKGIDLSFEKEYEEDGCTVKKYKPRRYTSGKFGTWCTQETYPETINCDCDQIYGKYAGENVRLIKVPSASKEPHFISLSEGVPNRYDMSNDEFKDSYVIMIGPSFSNIKYPDNPPKPLCKENPFSIYYVKRTEENKTVIGSTLGHSCFKAKSGGEEYAVGKHAVNSFEFYDRFIEPNGEGSFRGGEKIDTGSYIAHSPDFHMRKPLLDATKCLIELEVNGKGFRHGMFSEGEEPENPRQDKNNQKGTRQSVNMNKYVRFSEPIVRDVKAMSVAHSGGIVQRGENFTYPLVNRNRESSVYFELEGGLQEFTVSDADRDMNGMYGTVPEAGFEGDNASDRSFTGDTFTETVPLFENRAHYMTFIRKRPSQYGSPISQTYIPLGLEAEGMVNEVRGLVGDSFVGAMTYKRTGLVSDKTNRIISRIVSLGGFRSSSSLIKRIIGNLLRNIFQTLGIRNGGYVPKNQDKQDYIRVFGGLRYIAVSINSAERFYVGEVTDSGRKRIPPPFLKQLPNGSTTAQEGKDINYGDNYFPQNVKTQISSYYSSDVNLKYRQLNELENGEVYYSNNPSTLKGLNIDSSIPEDSEWEKGWLNRWYSIWKENARWKLIVQAIVLFVFTYGIGLWIMWKGLQFAVQSLSAIGGGSMALRTIGALTAVVFGIMVVVLGVAWIKFWITNDSDNKFVEEMLKLKNIRPDRKNADGSFSFNEKRLRNFEDNFWKYDFTHSKVNDFEICYGIPDPYNTCYCPTDYTNKALYSNRQIMNSQIDFWRNFKPNNDIEIPTTHGSISKMFVYGSDLYVHTTDMLMQIARGGSKGIDEDTILLGDGNFFGGVYSLLEGVVEGYAGLKDPNAAEVTAFGYFFPDRDAHKWYKFTGSGLPTPVSDLGVSRFMDENMDFELLNSFPDFKLVDLKLPGGIGYSFGINHNKGIAYFTKVDYKPIADGIIMNAEGTGFNVSLNNEDYFEDRSFTLSFDLTSKEGAWISFHSMTPFLYAWNRRDMYSFEENKMYKHDTPHKFLNFYGENYPAVVEFSVNDANGQQPSFDSFHYENTVIDSESFKWQEYMYKALDKTFNKALLYNSRQMTGVKDLIETKDLNYTELNKESHNIKINQKGKLWKLHNVNDYVIDDGGLMFKRKVKNFIKQPNEEALSNSIQNNIFYDNYLVNRLIFDIFDNTKVILKKVRTNIDVKNQQ